jgi:pyruvate dehydrogenase E2 component (dihydrolipoamide acetyltransferase)
MAKQAGLDLSAIAGSGPHGRIVKVDIEAAVERGVPAGAKPVPATAPAPAAAPAGAAMPSGPGAKQLADLLGMTYRLEPLTSVRPSRRSRISISRSTARWTSC